jgi:OHS family lactose permease-like MFS transporter
MTILRKDFLNFGGLFYFYFVIWAVVLGFLPLWLVDVAHLNTEQSGIVFSAMSLMALCYHPFFGYLQDKLGFKKNLFAVIAIALLFMGPFFNYVFIVLLQFNALFGAITGSLYLSLCFFGGVGVVEAYIEKVSRQNKFEYGHARLFGSLAGASATFVGGILYVKNPENIFWFASCSAIFLCVLLYTARVKESVSEIQAVKAVKNQIKKEDLFAILKMKNFWFLSLLIIGTASIYDVFDQQFPNYYVTFFDSKAIGTNYFSKIVSLQVALEAVLMVFAPAFVNKIGAKKGLLLFGFLTFIRIVGSAVFTTPLALSLIRLIAAFEMPLMLVSVMKYITGVFDVRLSATVYLLGFNLAKQASVFVFSYLAGSMYNVFGFQNTYLFLGAVVLIITLISVFTLGNDKNIKQEAAETSLQPQQA